MAIHQFYRLKEIIEKYLPSDQIERIHAAYETAKNAHEGQTRSSGEPYITHPVSVACILADLHLDCEAIMAALLHDVVEDTPVTGDQLRQLYGDTVANLVSGVTKLDKLQFSDYREAQAENFRKMIMAMVSDIRVILIKLADRTHNMRTIGSLRPDKRRRIARETQEIYAPIANRLGIHSIKDELEELCFEVMYPVRSRVIKEAVAYARKNRTGVVDRITGDITARLGKFNVKLVRLTNQQPAPYIIYDRMKTAHEPFHEIIDTYRRWHKWEWEFSEEHGLSDITRQDYQRLKDGDTRINHEHIHLPEWDELDHRQKEAFTNTERQCLNAWFNTLDQMVLRIGKEQTSEHTR